MIRNASALLLFAMLLPASTAAQDDATPPVKTEREKATLTVSRPPPRPEPPIHRGCTAYRLYTPRDGETWQCK